MDDYVSKLEDRILQQAKVAAQRIMQEPELLDYLILQFQTDCTRELTATDVNDTAKREKLHSLMVGLDNTVVAIKNLATYYEQERDDQLQQSKEAARATHHSHLTPVI